MACGAPTSRSSGGRSAVHASSGTPARSASTIAGCSSAAAVPLVVRTSAGRPVADPTPSARNAPERSSWWTSTRSRPSSAAATRASASGVEREPGHTTACRSPARTHSSTRVDANVACTSAGRAAPSGVSAGSVRGVVMAATRIPRRGAARRTRRVGAEGRPPARLRPDRPVLGPARRRAGSRPRGGAARRARPRGLGRRRRRPAHDRAPGRRRRRPGASTSATRWGPAWRSTSPPRPPRSSGRSCWWAAHPGSPTTTSGPPATPPTGPSPSASARTACPRSWTTGSVCRCSPACRPRRASSRSGGATPPRGSPPASSSPAPVRRRRCGRPCPASRCRCSSIAGADDHRYADIAERTAQAIGANATWAVVPGAGHSAHLEQPDRFVDLVRPWLREVAAG